MSEILSGSSGILSYLSFKGGIILANISSFVNTILANLVAYQVCSFWGAFRDTSWTPL